MSVLKLMTGWDYGHNLTSFILCDGFTIEPYMLKLLLQQMPNLKVLRIWNGHVVLDVGDVHLEKNQFQLPPLSQLKMLKLRTNYVVNQPERLSRSGFNTWVVNSYVESPTLTHLEIEDDDNKICLSLRNFPSFKSLKLWFLKENIFATSESLPLALLSISYVDSGFTTFEVFTDFLKKFSSTLVHLEINGVPITQLEPNGFNFGKKITSQT